ncbi:MAG: hypothetical protein JWM59_4248 [Verrucomicrobiales bacterium]|nr:hypothetical protein [Verrucomicrobiales bacterium]
MRVDQISAVLRPRSSQEAADLGFSLVRRHAGAVFKAWLTLLVPLWGLLIVLLHDYPSVMVLMAWWLKPLYDRVVLFHLGRALFGAAPSLRTQLRAWPRLLTRQLLPALLWGRFSTVRSFVLPVLVLEDMQGKPARQRAALLRRHGGVAAASLTSMCGVLEMAVLAGIITFVRPFVPEDMVETITSGRLLADYGASIVPPALLWTVGGCYLMAMALMEPFYAGAGFGLYLNARAHLEGWDVEVAFRRLGARLRSRPGNRTSAPAPVASPLPPPPPLAVSLPGSAPPLPLPGLHARAEAPTGTATGGDAGTGQNPHSRWMMLLLTAASVWFFSAGLSTAATVDPQEVKYDIEEVLKHPDFINHKEKYKEWKFDSSSGSKSSSPSSSGSGSSWSFPSLPGWFKGLFSGDLPAVALRLLLVAICLALVSWLVFLAYKNRWKFTGLRGGPRGPQGPRTIMGLEILPESLPEDIPREARACWSRGESEAAVRLLYRGALAWLVQRGSLPIRESDTEGDCLRHAATLPDRTRMGYFENLTAAWRGTAYDGMPPDSGTMQELCARWPFALTVDAAPIPRADSSPPAPSSRPRPAVTALLALAAVLVLPGCGHYEEKERELGHQGEARRDPWLAATRLLERHHYQVSAARGILQLPDSDTLMIVPADAVTTDMLARHALRWVEDHGGHLVYLAQGGNTAEDDWREGSRRHATPSQPLLEALHLSESTAAASTGPVTVNIDSTAYRITDGSSNSLNTTAETPHIDIKAGSTKDTALISMPYGAGRVTVLADAWPFRNRHIGEEDNAALLLALAGMDENVRAVQFVKAGRVSLWEMLTTEAWPALTGLTVLLLAWLWHCMPRFGPVQALSRHGPRQFATHLEEAGWFFWKHRLSEVLLNAPRQAVITAARRRSLRETEGQFIPLLAAWSGLSEDRVRLAMESGEIRDPRIFTQQMADLQKILHSI